MTLGHDTEKRFHSDISLYIADWRSLKGLTSMKTSTRNIFLRQISSVRKERFAPDACVKAFTFSLCDNKGVIYEKALGRFLSLHLGDLRTIHGVLPLRFLFFGCASRKQTPESELHGCAVDLIQFLTRLLHCPSWCAHVFCDELTSTRS